LILDFASTLQTTLGKINANPLSDSFIREPKAGSGVCSPTRAADVPHFEIPFAAGGFMTLRSRFVLSSLLLSLALLFSTQTYAQDRAEMEKKITALKEELKQAEKEFLEPSAEDKAAYAEFLGRPDTGLIRLMPREKFKDDPSIRRGGAYYSFTHLSHDYDVGADIQFESQKLSVGFAGADFGFLTSLGETPIESLTQEHIALDFLLNFTTPSEEPKAREQQRNTSIGFQVKERSYINRLDAKVGMTYALRSIDYGRSDVLVVLRVVRQDVDGSLILAWKLVKSFPKPELLRP
jgi:hypothetical protein